MSKWIWIVMIMAAFFSLGVRDGRGEVIEHSAGPLSQEENPSRPLDHASKMREGLYQSGWEWSQGLPTHHKTLIEKLLWGSNKEEALSDLKQDKEFLHKKDNPEGVLDILPSIEEEKLQKDIARWLRTAGDLDKAENSREQFANSLAERLQHPSFQV